jgi:hypothetical protein
LPTDEHTSLLLYVPKTPGDAQRMYAERKLEIDILARRRDDGVLYVPDSFQLSPPQTSRAGLRLRGRDKTRYRAVLEDNKEALWA